MSEKGKLSKFWIHELTRPAFENWLENEQEPVVVIGLGSIEQHGPHLPLGMDSLGARAFIHAVASRTNSVCVHPCFPGYSPHHMGFKGTITFSEATMLGAIMDVIESLASHGVKRFVLSNHHGGNRNIMNLAVQLAKRDYGVMVAAPSGPSDTELARVHSDRQKRLWDVHSGINETGAALHLFPELVEMWRIPDDWEPTLDIHPRLREYMDPDRDDYELVSQVRQASSEPDTDDFSDDGIYGLGDPRDTDPEEYSRWFAERVQFFVDFIETWKSISIPDAFRD